jgi:hypothetical protein
MTGLIRYVKSSTIVFAKYVYTIGTHCHLVCVTVDGVSIGEYIYWPLNSS